MQAKLSDKYALLVGLLQNYLMPSFTPVKRGRRQKAVSRTFFNKDGAKSLEISMFEQLDGADQDLFLSILSLCGENGEAIQADDLLYSSGAIKGHSSIVIEASGYELLKRSGRKTGGNDHKWLEKSLDRLSKTSLKFKGEKATWRVNLLNYSFENEDGGVGGIKIFVNPIASFVFTGNSKVGYTKHSLTDRLSLSSETAKILYAYLLGLIRSGGSRVLKLETLVEQVYIDPAPSERAERYRRTEVKKALGFIAELKGWSVEIEKNKVMINRARTSK